MNERQKRGTVGILFLLIGGVWVWGNLRYLYHQEFVRIAQSAQGHVISVVRNGGEDGPLYDLVVEFITGAGATRQFTVGGSYQSYQIGDSVDVLYDPTSPYAGK